LKQSLADSSFDAWIKYYRQDENAPNAIVSYYAKGALIALALDLTLRSKTDGRVSARRPDAQALAASTARPAVGVPEDGVRRAAEAVSGLKLRKFFSEGAEGTEDLPLETCCAQSAST
jgi:predicted metalloprotease with PDZ domain